MHKRFSGGLVVLWVSTAVALAVGCSKDAAKPTSNAGTSGGAGTSAGSSGTGATTDGGAGGDSFGDPTKPNLDCPAAIGPLDGPYAQKGACCYRTSNKYRNESLHLKDGAVATVEYRALYSITINHPKTLGQAAIVTAGIGRGENEEQSLLYRLTGPRGADESAASGDSMSEIGQGRYNCDGTYSFYGNKAAPMRTNPKLNSDPARWQGKITPSYTDATKSGVDQGLPTWSKTYRGKSWTPFLNSATFVYEWDLVTRGLNPTKSMTGKDHQDCTGERQGSMWVPGGQFETYANLEENDIDNIPELNQTFCEEIVFGPGQPQDDMHSCSKTKRCMPGSTGCTWQKLPDSLCPVSADEEKIFGCHVGDEKNEDKAPTNCTATKPTTPLDNTKDPKVKDKTVSEGQCCDPMGTSTTLPACNAYRLVNDTVMAAVQITDDPVNEFQKDCHPM